MNLSSPFIKRPVGTTLLTLAIALAGLAAFALLPVAPLPQVDFPTIRVQAQMPGAGPETMAATVATPLERALGRIAGITEMRSTSSTGSVSITLQFDLDRDIDGAARDVQAAINAARSLLPNLPSNPTYWKMNPADSPVMILGLTSDTVLPGELFDVAQTVISRKLSQLYGVGQVSVWGSSLPAVRVETDPGAVHRAGLSLADIRTAITRANANLPKGVLQDGTHQWTINADDRLLKAADFAPLILRRGNGTVMRLSDVATVVDSVEDVRNLGYTGGKSAVLLAVFKQPGSNIIEVVDRVKQTLPLLRAWMPEGADFKVIMDRSPSISESLRDVESTLVIAMGLVGLVVLLFLRNWRAALIPGAAVPVSLLGTFAVMYLLGFSLNHLSLMALTIAVGFVVDDAIVVTENIVRHTEDGISPLRAARLGSREVSFTVFSITLSLVAIFIPILGMGGIVGRLFREFALSLSAAVLVSLAVSLTATPMMCAHLLRREKEDEDPKPGLLERMGFSKKSLSRAAGLWGDGLDFLHEGYARTLAIVLRHKRLALLCLAATVALNVYLYVVVPKGFFPMQDTGQLFGMLQADQSISFQAIQPKMLLLMQKVESHPAVSSVAGFTGGMQRNSGMVFVTLKPLQERKKDIVTVMGELRRLVDGVPGVMLTFQPMQDLRAGGQRSAAAQQYVLQSDDLSLLRDWTPRIAEAMKKISGVTDLSHDQEIRGLETKVLGNRDLMAKLGVNWQQTDTALGLAFGQSFASTLYADANQYRVVMEYGPRYQESAESLAYVYVPAGHRSTASADAAGSGTGISSNSASSSFGGSGNGTLAPLRSFARAVPSLTSLSVSHQNQFAASTITFNLLPEASLSLVQKEIEKVMADLHVPETVRGEFGGTSRLAAGSSGGQPLLILAALVTLYIVLGVLYESYIHPLTILSTLPSAGVGAILGLMLFGAEFTVIAFIGVLLLCGIVKKNAIMMIDFALEARRNEGLNAEEAVYKACLLRFRPIMMTTMAAVGGAVPLLLGRGDGAELRTPLGITIVGGLLVSQLLTLYTTPVVYLYLDRFSREKTRGSALTGPAAKVPQEIPQ